MEDFAGMRVTVAGLGHFGGGIAVSRWLVERGAKVLVTDLQGPEKLADSLPQIADLPVELRLGEHREQDFTSADLVVASPAIKPASRYLQAARNAGVKVTTEICLFVERCPAKIIGITGTKGKSTTTAMLGHVLKDHFRTHVGGNIGVSLLSILPEIQNDDLVVLELSSFMLEYLGEARWSPELAIITMIAADHLDRHGTFEAYLEAKKNLVRFQSADDLAILPDACAYRDELAAATAARVVTFGRTGKRLFDLPVPGDHNQLNAQAVFAAASSLGIPWEDTQSALATFSALRHRLELVHESLGVRYYDDSIATIPEAAIAALVSFPPGKVIQIIGGSDKGLPYGAMLAAIKKRAKAALCIGTTGPLLAAGLADAEGSARVYECGNLASAMEQARQIAAPGDVVLLSTGYASYDQFTNFEFRGNEFARLARDA